MICSSTECSFSWSYRFSNSFGPSRCSSPPISSADLSHAGPAFGDPHPLGGEEPQAKAARDKVVQHDREMLALIAENKPHELVSSMAWQQNPTRWCSIGNIVATLLAVEATKVELLNYVAAMDQQGMTLVSSAGALIH
jgi:hypothetical protein